MLRGLVDKRKRGGETFPSWVYRSSRQGCDTGLLHRLLNIADVDSLLGNPVLGHSWEGFIIENILNSMSDKWRSSYYRTTVQAEIDLVLESPRKPVKTCRRPIKFVVYSGTKRYPMSEKTEGDRHC
ncbi:MAG: DUF4143 domain-containing protein [Gammaproteobacteria bacterium]|nr:DUF4143 domain-containing protein [Gammaproteobacteria bacterium]